jgi:hypothetical protein
MICSYAACIMLAPMNVLIANTFRAGALPSKLAVTTSPRQCPAWQGNVK